MTPPLPRHHRGEERIPAPTPAPRVRSKRRTHATLSREAYARPRPLRTHAKHSLRPHPLQALIEEYKASESPDYINWGMDDTEGGLDDMYPGERMPGDPSLASGAH